MKHFQPDQRLHNPGEFAAVLKQRGIVRGSCFELHRRPVGKVKARLGLIIPKRFAKQSVLRNLVKRQVREIFRCRALALPAEDFVIRLVRAMKDIPDNRAERSRWVRFQVEALFESVTPPSES